MAYETDERLKSYLDTNQLHREQLCLAILALDKRFTNVRPRHPRGGPDGGRDIEVARTFSIAGFPDLHANTGIRTRLLASHADNELAEMGAPVRDSLGNTKLIDYH